MNVVRRVKLISPPAPKNSPLNICILSACTRVTLLCLIGEFVIMRIKVRPVQE